MAQYINGKKVVEGYTEGARVYNNANISIAHNTTTNLTFNSERYDTDSIHSTSSNTGQLICKTAGIYIIGVTVQFDSNSTGYRSLNLYLNGTTIAMHNAPALATINNRLTINSVWKMAVNDYAECAVFQNSGGALNIETAADRSPEFWMQRIG